MRSFDTKKKIRKRYWKRIESSRG